MFLQCFAKKPLVYHNYNRTLVLNPGMNCVDASLFPIEDLIKTYGLLINVIGDDKIEQKDVVQELLDNNKEVKDFLEGGTDLLPEGTVEVPTEEVIEIKPECVDCYSDGKTPDEESCKNCDKVVKSEGTVEVPTEDKPAEAVVPVKKTTARKSTKRAK